MDSIIDSIIEYFRGFDKDTAVVCVLLLLVGGFVICGGVKNLWQLVFKRGG